jgi:AcrR family transcriptional regulator
MVELCAEQGYRGVTVRGLSGLAGVSTKAFYDCFANVEECFGATHVSVFRDIIHCASRVDCQGDARLRSAIDAVFAFLGENPKAAHLILLEAVAAGLPITDKARSTAFALERLISDELIAGPQPVSIPAPAAQAIVGAALRVLRTPLLAGRPEEIPGLAHPFVDWLLALRDERLSRIWSAYGGARKQRLTRSAPVAAIGDDRQFLLRAVLRLSASDGYEGLTVPAIRREAGVPRRSFDDSFAGVEDCFLVAVESLVVGVGRWAVQQGDHSGSWDRRLVRTLDFIAAELSRDRVFARQGLIEILAPGLAGLACRERIITRWAEELRRIAPAATRPSGFAVEASLAAIWRIAAREVAGGRADRVRRLVPGMAFLVLAPAIGPAPAEHAIAAELGYKGAAR